MLEDFNMQVVYLTKQQLCENSQLMIRYFKWSFRILSFCKTGASKYGTSRKTKASEGSSGLSQQSNVQMC